jgi:hypothetical protein
MRHCGEYYLSNVRMKPTVVYAQCTGEAYFPCTGVRAGQLDCCVVLVLGPNGQYYGSDGSLIYAPP